jgi:hypothetical protein
MTPPTSNEVTQLLRAWSDGQQEALEKLVSILKQARAEYARLQ